MSSETERYHVHQAAKIIRHFIQNERAMREHVFQHQPSRRAVKVAEADQNLRAFDWLMGRLYEARPDLRSVEAQAKQPPLFEEMMS